MSQNENPSPNDPEALAVYLLEASARKGLGPFLELFRKDFASKIDFSQGYELLDDELPQFISEAQRQESGTFTLFVKATLKTGQPCRFLLRAIWMGDAKFGLGISEVPDGAQGMWAGWN